jgi:hypothetical protein
MSLYKLSWAIWIPGTVLIFLSWGGIVSPKVGNIGWWMAMAGAVLSFIPVKRRAADAPPAGKPSTVVADLDTLARLRERGDLTEEEYQRQRTQLLGDSGPKA